MPSDPWGDTSGTSSGYDPFKGNNPGGGSGGGWWDSVKNWWQGGDPNKDLTGGGGGGFGGGGGKTAGVVAGAGKTAAAVLPWLQFVAAVIEGNKNGKFVMPPMTPEQKKMFDYAMSVLQGTPKQSDYMFPILGYDLGHPATLDMDALKRGDIGFHPAGHMSNDELAKILNGGTAAPPPAPPAPPGIGGKDSAGTGTGASFFDRGERRVDSLLASGRKPLKQ